MTHTDLFPHDTFSLHGGKVSRQQAYRDAMNGVLDELNAAEARYADGNAQQALYHLLRANGCLGIATGIAAVAHAITPMLSERLDMGQKILTLLHRLTSTGGIKRTLCDCAVPR